MELLVLGQDISLARGYLAAGIFILLSGAVLSFVIGFGILKLKHWAWYLVVAGQILNILHLPNAVLFWGTQAFDLTKSLVNAVIFLIILWFFMRPKIKEQLMSGPHLLPSCEPRLI